MDKSNHEQQHCHGAHICLVGANRLQNEMFVTTMKKRCQCKNMFTVASSLTQISTDILTKTNPRNLFYLDCFGLESQELKLLLDSAYLTMQPRHYWALFNLAVESGIEKVALNYGVRGFFYLGDSLADFCKGTRTILGGEVWLSRQLASEVILAGVRPPPRSSCEQEVTLALSAREKEVLTHLISGAPCKEVAAELFISVNTLRTHLHHIYRKLNVHNRVQAIYWAEKNL